MKKDKKYTRPEAIVVLFNDEDIIVTSNGNGGYGNGWGDDPRDEFQD